MGRLIVAPLLTNAQSFFAPKIIDTLKPSALANSQTFFAPRPILTVSPQAVATIGVVFAPTIKNSIKAPQVTNTNTVSAPTRLAGNTVAPLRLANAQAFFAPIVSGGVAVGDLSWPVIRRRKKWTRGELRVALAEVQKQQWLDAAHAATTARAQRLADVDALLAADEDAAILISAL